MRSSFTVATGLKLVRTPNYRHQAIRRRWLIGGAVVVLLIAGGLMETAKAPEAQLTASGGKPLLINQETLP